MNQYILITPAKNEARTIEDTIKSVVSQTIQPAKWIVVSDSSIDGTDEIIKNYEKKYNFIKYCRIENDCKRNFGSKALAFNFGYQNIGNIEYRFIGNLDADVTFENNYFEKLLLKLNNDRGIGIGGGLIYELQKKSYKKLSYNLNSVAGAVQLFRRECFEGIGGYIEIKHGGIDAVAEVMSRMKGWRIQTFEDLRVYHHRKIGTDNNSGMYRAKYRSGIRDYNIGAHPIFFIIKAIDRFKEDPIIIGSILMLLGYFRTYLIKQDIDIPENVFKYARAEQIMRIRSELLMYYNRILIVFNNK